MNLEQLRSRHVVLVTALVLGMGGAAAHGQRPQGGGGGAMIVDFTAVTADGKPVADLNPADVTVKIAGKLRTVTALTLKKVEPAAAAATAAPTAAPAAAASAPFSTNDPAAVAAPKGSSGGRSFMIVVDTESLRPGTEPAIKQAIEGLLKDLTSADRVALSTAPTDTAQVGFGTALPRVREAVAAIRSTRPATIENADTLCRTHNTLTFLRSLLSPLAGNEAPTAVVFIAATLSTPGKDTGNRKDKNCEVISDEYNSLSGAAGAARANVYVVQGDPGTMGRDPGLDNLAGVTGAGAVMRVVNDGFAPRVLADASGYWVATLAPDPSDRPGQSQRLEIKAVKEGVTVRSRPEVVMSRANAAPGAAPAKPGTTSPKDMIGTTAPFTDLQLRATAVVQRGTAEKMNVLVFAEPVDPTVKISAMQVGFFDAAGKGASVPAPQLTSFPIATGLPLNIGQYRIRVAATDSTGKSGAVDINLDTNLATAGTLKLSGLLLGPPNAQGSLQPKLLLSTEEKVIVYLELYGVFNAGIELKFEVAKSDTGPALTTLKASGGGPGNEPDKFTVFGEVPLTTLAPGDYVIRAVVKMGDQPSGTVLRTFRKIAK